MYTFPDTLLGISVISQSFNCPQDYTGQLTFKSTRTCIESRAYVAFIPTTLLSKKTPITNHTVFNVEKSNKYKVHTGTCKVI